MCFKTSPQAETLKQFRLSVNSSLFGLYMYFTNERIHDINLWRGKVASCLEHQRTLFQKKKVYGDVNSTYICLQYFSTGENLPVCQKLDKASDRKFYTANSHIIDIFLLNTHQNPWLKHCRSSSQIWPALLSHKYCYQYIQTFFILFCAELKAMLVVMYIVWDCVVHWAVSYKIEWHFTTFFNNFALTLSHIEKSTVSGIFSECFFCAAALSLSIWKSWSFSERCWRHGNAYLVFSLLVHKHFSSF